MQSVLEASTADPLTRRGVSSAEESVRDRGWAVLSGVPFLVDGHVDHDVVRRAAQAFGRPSTRDGGRAVWPVRPRSQRPDATFSCRAGAVDLHTDAQYHRFPEQRVCLFVARPADDGGATRLLPVRDAVTALERLPEAGRMLDLLGRPVWRWRVPWEFRAARDGAPAAPSAPVLGPHGTIRWRGDNLSESMPAESRAAAATVTRCWEAAPEVLHLDLRGGDMLILDNRRVLHGRTAFEDPERLLLRVRLWGDR